MCPYQNCKPSCLFKSQLCIYHKMHCISLFLLITNTCFLQGVCADQNKVFGYHCYQQVTLNEAALAELKHLFSAKAEILHQTVALHSYTSILSRLQVESYLYRLFSSNPTTKSVAVQDTSTGKFILISLDCILDTNNWLVYTVC